MVLYKKKKYSSFLGILDGVKINEEEMNSTHGRYNNYKNKIN
jgi:hypothetical protein